MFNVKWIVIAAAVLMMFVFMGYVGPAETGFNCANSMIGPI